MGNMPPAQRMTLDFARCDEPWTPSTARPLGQSTTPQRRLTASVLGSAHRQRYATSAAQNRQLERVLAERGLGSLERVLTAEAGVAVALARAADRLVDALE